MTAWWIKYKTLRNDIVSKLRTAKTSFSNLATVRSEPKKFWAIIRSLKPHITSTEVFTDGLSTASTPMEKANMLNTRAASIQLLCPQTTAPCQILRVSLSILIAQLMESLTYGREPKSIRPRDQMEYLHGCFTLLLLHELAPSIASLFNLSMKTGKLPDEWKLANVIPIPKNSHIHDVRSCHPISLLSIITKTLERF